MPTSALRHVVMLAALLSPFVACGGEEETVDELGQRGVSADDSGLSNDENAVSGDSGGDALVSTDMGSGRPPAEWTVLVYLMGDNDLEGFAVGDIAEMAAAGSNERVNIVTLIDRHPGYSDDLAVELGDFDSTKVVHVGREEVLSQRDIGEVNTGDASALEDFLVAGVSEFPADKYALIIWDHGAGWNGMGPDESDGDDLLTLPEIRTAITDGLEHVGVESLDLLGFDACLMATYEVASYLSSVADVLVASEELEPGHGWDFSSLEVLRDTPDVSASDLAAELVETYAAQAAEAETNLKITLSAVDLTKMSNLEDAMTTFAEALRDADGTDVRALSAARAQALEFGTSPDVSLASHLIDLGDLMNELGPSGSSLTREASGIVDALKDVVVSEVSGLATRNATGLSVYFPPSIEYFDSRYLEIENIPGWTDVLETVFVAGQQLADGSKAALDPANPVTITQTHDGITVSGIVPVESETGLVGAEIIYGVVDEEDGSVIFIGEEPAALIELEDGRVEVSATYDLTALTLSDGVDSDFAYLDMDIDTDSELWFLDVPLWYIPPEEFDSDALPHDVTLSLTLDPTGSVVSEVYYEITSDGMIGELVPHPDGLIFPVLLNRYPDGDSEWVTLSDVGLFADLPSLSYELVPLASGTELVVELVVTDYSGGTAAQSASLTLP